MSDSPSPDREAVIDELIGLYGLYVKYICEYVDRLRPELPQSGITKVFWKELLLLDIGPLDEFRGRGAIMLDKLNGQGQKIARDVMSATPLFYSVGPESWPKERNTEEELELMTEHYEWCGKGKEKRNEQESEARSGLFLLQVSSDADLIGFTIEAIEKRLAVIGYDDLYLFNEINTAKDSKSALRRYDDPDKLKSEAGNWVKEIEGKLAALKQA